MKKQTATVRQSVKPLFVVIEGAASITPDTMELGSDKHWNYLQAKKVITRGDLVEMARGSQGAAGTAAWNMLILLRMTIEEAAAMQGCPFDDRRKYAFQVGALQGDPAFFIDVLKRFPFQRDDTVWSHLIGIEHQVEDILEVLKNCGDSPEAHNLKDTVIAHILKTLPHHKGALQQVVRSARTEAQKKLAQKLLTDLQTRLVTA